MRVGTWARPVSVASLAGLPINSASYPDYRARSYKWPVVEKGFILEPSFHSYQCDCFCLKPYAQGTNYVGTTE